jgi:site-specific recombinase XerD
LVDTRSVQAIVTGCAQDAGIAKRVHRHLLRHSIATILDGLVAILEEVSHPR